ncbi:hypothetical protein M8C21_010130, partial [Ambrosia artemisiifolia]
SLKDTILSNAENGTPVTCLVYTLLLPWAAEVARGLNVRSAMLWIQPASVLRVYYYYFNGYKELIGDDCTEPSWSIQLPGLPQLKIRDLPSFCNPSNTYSFALPLFKEQFDILELEDKPTIFVNSFDALEEEALQEIEGKLKLLYSFMYKELIGDDCTEPSWSIKLPGLPQLKIRDLPSFCNPSNTYSFALPLFKEQFDTLELEDKPKIFVNSFDALEEEALQEIEGKLKLVAVGPLIPSAFLDGKDPSDKSFGGDLFKKTKDYVEWMNTKPKGSIVYISFGSLIMLSKEQKEAMAHALLESGRPFLWVIREKDGEEDEEMSRMDELEQLGLIVPWCSQLEVLSHPSLGCFVTHCGWNSTLESISCGVPVVAFPHWTDQSTNAKLIEDVWGTGVRVTSNEDGVVEGEEIRRCVEMVMGGHERGVTMRQNAKKWKDLAREVTKEGGSSYTNLKAFVEQVGSSTNDKVVNFMSKEVQALEAKLEF